MLMLLLISPSDGLCVQGRPPTWLGKSRFAGRSSGIVAKPMPSHFPYGSSNFEDIRLSGQFFRDNTRCIAALESLQRAGTVLLTRPTRWGKTLLQRMLMVYYDEHTTQQKYEELFRGLHVYNHTTERRGKYQVLGLNFANAEGSTPDARERALWAHINDKCASFAKKYGYKKEIVPHENAMITLQRLASAVKARKDSWGWRRGWRRKRPWRTRPPELYIFIDEYDSYIYSLLRRSPFLQEPTEVACEDLDSGVPVVTALNKLKELQAEGLVSRCMIIGLARVKWAEGSKANNIEVISAEESLRDACGLGLDDIKRGLDYLNLTEAQTLEALKLMKHCFNGYRFPGVGTDTDDGLYNAQLCIRFLQRLCKEENLRWLDPSDDKHWEKLTDNALLDRMNDDNSDPSWAMLELLARSGKAAADDLVVLANNQSLKHSEDLLGQRYSIKALLDDSQLLEERDAVAAARNFMYDMGLATLDASGTEIRAPNAVVEDLLRRKAVPAAKTAKKRRTGERIQQLMGDFTVNFRALEIEK